MLAAIVRSILISQKQPIVTLGFLPTGEARMNNRIVFSDATLGGTTNSSLYLCPQAEVAELVDAHVSGACGF